MKIIALLNEKGGVGKTTLATHIAAGLAIRGLRVVLADGDPQGQAGLLMGQQKEPGLYNLLIRDEEFRDVLRAVPPEVYGEDGSQGELWLLPGNIETRVISQINPNPFLIRERFAELNSWADVVVFDTSPSPSNFHTAIYMAADSILIPTNCTFLSLDGVAYSVAHQEQARALREQNQLGIVERMGIIPTMYQGTQVHDINLQDLLKVYGRHVWPAVPLRKVWQEAAQVGKLLFNYSPKLEAYDSRADKVRTTATGEMWAMIERIEKLLAVEHV